MKLFVLFGALLMLSLPLEGAGADIQLVSEAEAIQPGVPFTVALHILPNKHYHTYWKYPGIVGLPTSVEWQLPDGFHAGEISWPVPEIVNMSGHPAHGFRRELLLLVVITPPREITTSSVRITGELAWMACHKECHPGFATRSLVLPVNHTSEKRFNQEWAAAFQKEREAMAEASSLWTVSLESGPDENSVVIRIRPDAGASTNPGQIYFFSEDGQITSEPAQEVRRLKDGSYIIEGTRSDFSPKGRTALPGILTASKGWAVGKTLPAFRINPSYSVK